MENRKNKITEAVKKAAKEGIYIDAIMNSDGDIYNVPCKINTQKWADFKKGIEILKKLQTEGKCTFEAADLEKEYTLHTIYVEWDSTNDYWMTIDSSNRKEIKEMIDLFDTITIAEDTGTCWQFASEIYKPISELEGNGVND